MPGSLNTPVGAERSRLAEDSRGAVRWKLWGPYLSERQWGTVREDYSPHGTAWDYFPHDHARSRAYRWGEDGIAGLSDEQQLLCFALALWNGKDPILKERLFGLTNAEGNHGEDVKELYYYLDATPTHSYLKYLYKYPQAAFPYARLVEENRRRGRNDPEFELIDTGVFEADEYFDVFVEYAKAGPEDVLVRITAHNRGPQAAALHLLPQLWFRNTWSWSANAPRPEMHIAADGSVAALHAELGEYRLYADGRPDVLFTDNDSNRERLFGVSGDRGHWKDAFHEYVVHGRDAAVNVECRGTKAALHHRLRIAAGETAQIRLRLRRGPAAVPFEEFELSFGQRVAEADGYYAALQSGLPSEDARSIQRQAFAGLIWSKQFYFYDIAQWLDGDPAEPPPPQSRHHGRNADWRHLNNRDILSLPDKWEYPWYAAWDLAFHCIPLALLDAAFAKRQLVTLARAWYMHPNGQLPAYEWDFSHVNPPVHAWAAWQVFQIDRKNRSDQGDLAFLERILHKLMLNFTWWVNRKDAQGRNIFQGGFLGLDNIGVFDRSAPLPTGGHINQADGTAWMAMYCLNLMRIALELARHNRVYEDIATKFFEHFLYIAEAMTNMAGAGIGLWNAEDQFFYDELSLPDGRLVPLKVRSIVGLIPLFAVETLEPELLDELPEFRRRLEWFLNYRPDLTQLVSRMEKPGVGERRLLSLLRADRVQQILRRVLDQAEFLSDFGIRALSKYHEQHPFVFEHGGERLSVSYQPGESGSGVFGGNSNWRGPVWFPVNYLLIESLQKFHHYYGDEVGIECPTGSGSRLTLEEVAEELTLRLSRIFLRDAAGRRAVFGENSKLQNDPDFRDYVPFYEYFHGDNGRGAGASHQTGWTGLIARLLQPSAYER
ncbi:MAG TPA: glucosidase [Hyphomicrobiaceae bacterium]